uniref:Uncharacterized protein n=1 Tax=Candidatus Kentrum eta TaxID=2126337 RepID=A0A450U8A6_9GAMM|nr:MAG: hypothetical protein BECKH772A_GA0070896_1000719 [Candidatus Kentron sp. H]VFJ90166.1 MAG: hypothetical protein BECKH772B_GA0070898_1000819 [Candidatus Kentron sp. H]VFJ96536.1 MAG: hypothetical protein BECKH772C_GA0070978_1000719 [Candidatus Kentron sp. H]
MIRYGECSRMILLDQDNVASPLSRNLPSKGLEEFDNFPSTEHWQGSHVAKKRILSKSRDVRDEQMLGACIASTPYEEW